MTLKRTTTRFPLNTLAIAFGLAGLANVWTAATAALNLTPVFAVIAWLLALAAWVWLIVAHLDRGRRSTSTLRSQLRDPIQGPIAALVPVVGMLLAAALRVVWLDTARILVVVFICLTAAFAAWLLSTWLRGGLEIDAVHGGYFLPTVAGGFIAAITAAEVGLPAVAVGAFAVGAFFWAVMFALIGARLMFRPPLPTPLVPTLAIFVAPPAVAGTAWYSIVGATDPIAVGLAGLTILMLLVQLSLIPFYRRLPFSLGFWSFTFPFAAVAADGIGWLARLHPWGWPVPVIVSTAIITALVAAIAIKSIRLRFPEHHPTDTPAVAPAPTGSSMPSLAVDVAASTRLAVMPQREQIP
ncbi:hypothetical protein ITJ64_05115 [Herbiconiux sp. VKM Ac-1786]|uniref:SLAC1 family transporter n=1 Tax=Herbiconiux sp. VKM Ac-1786 TaxID=2783824 RepID=UPI00188D4D60|nr:hypothetical protein [Herbiconiux sp. VKM Ac-1786]MBF4571890.1 hypothetical protein [Herbiconiux sp. VKM Ac-1786]